MTNCEREKQLIAAVGLLRIPGVGRGRFLQLVRALGSAEQVVRASISELVEVRGISRALASGIHKLYNEEEASQIVQKIDELGWNVVLYDDDGYPALLREIATFPPLLFRVGNPISPDEKMIAIVGTRHPSERGRHFTYELAKALASHGITVVSGMAEGIDSVAHTGALDGGGKTVAVWGNSLDELYPPSNRALAERIRAEGTIFSEYFPETRPDRTTFPERNRIISGLSVGVVVVEAGRKSGALITASHAIEQNREVFAVPGAPWSKTSLGTNELIKNGATLLTSVEDIFRVLPVLSKEVVSKKFLKLPDLTDIEKKIISQFTTEPVQLDNISRATEIPVADLSQFLLALELKGVVRELAGKRFVLADEFIYAEKDSYDYK